MATGIVDEPFITHFALRVFQRLGFETSPIPESADKPREPGVGGGSPADPMDVSSVALAFDRLDSFMASGSLTKSIAVLEAHLSDADAQAAAEVLASSGLDEDLVDSALIVRERIGMLDTLIHAAVIVQVLPLILRPGERVLKRPSLGAGNDPTRNYDLETTHRIAEFKLSSWKGADGGRQRGLFADVVGLSLDATDRLRQVFVVGDRPVRFLTESDRNAAKTLSKAALKLRTPEGLTGDTTVAQFARAARIEIVDLRTLIPKLR
ncbi:hypothetical protein ACK8HX_05100 [Oryzobacter sp. R7]|uniref:hypothetical protein n=1 Tax=Oryzobacter faecalis TaxID=3388656 RepID=UPI00398D53CF